MSSTLIGLGDVMLGRDVPAAAVEEVLIAPEVRDHLDGGLVTANLECVIAREGLPANPLSHAAFQVDPATADRLLPPCRVLSLANNHTFDFGDAGAESTIEYLNARGIVTVGVGRDRAAALEPARVEVNGVQFSIFGLTTVANPPPGRCEYQVASPGIDAMDAVQAESDAGRVVVVHLHAGRGDTPTPHASVVRLHRRLRGRGARVVLGHHPHVVQPVTVDANGRYSFYSLGDFLFDRCSDGRDRALIAMVSCAPGSVAADAKVVVRGRDLVVRATAQGYPPTPDAEIPCTEDRLRDRLAHYRSRAQREIGQGRLRTLPKLAWRKLQRARRAQVK